MSLVLSVRLAVGQWGYRMESPFVSSRGHGVRVDRHLNATKARRRSAEVGVAVGLPRAAQSPAAPGGATNRAIGHVPVSVVDGRDAPSRPGRKAHNCHPSRPSRSYAFSTSRQAVVRLGERVRTRKHDPAGLRAPVLGAASWPPTGERSGSSRHVRSPWAARQPPAPSGPDRRFARATRRSRTRRGIPATRPATPGTGPAAPRVSAPRRSTAVAAIFGPPAGGTGSGTRRPAVAPGSAPAAPRSSTPQDNSTPLRNGPGPASHFPRNGCSTSRNRCSTSAERDTTRDGGHESGFPVRVEGRRRLRIESPFRSSL